MKNIILVICAFFMLAGCNIEPYVDIEKTTETKYSNKDLIYETPDGHITLTLSYDTARQGDYIYDLHSDAIGNFISTVESKYR